MVDRGLQHVFRVDMNALRGDQVGTLLTLAADPVGAQLFPPAPGDVVLAVDEDGDLYHARVDIVDGIWVGVTIDWASRTSSTDADVEMLGPDRKFVMSPARSRTAA